MTSNFQLTLSVLHSSFSFLYSSNLLCIAMIGIVRPSFSLPRGISAVKSVLPVFHPLPAQLSHLRFNSQFTQAQIDQAKKWLTSVSSNDIPKHDFEISYSRSSGPGGQKVNKTSSKATIALEPEKWLTKQCYWIPAPIKEQLELKKIRYETKLGGILIQCDSSRNREVNTVECFTRLLDEIKRNVYFEAEAKEEDIAKWDEIAKERAEKIKFQKKRQSDKKKSRSKKFDF